MFSGRQLNNHDIVFSESTAPYSHLVFSQTDRLYIKCVIIIIINLINVAQFDTNGVLTALHIVVTYIQCNMCIYEHT